MIENWLYPITRQKWGGGWFELILIATDESRMQVSILRPLQEIVISYTLGTPKTFGEESE